MTKDPAFGSLPRQAYSGSLLERAAALRGDDAKLAAFLKHPRAGVYVVELEAQDRTGRAQKLAVEFINRSCGRDCSGVEAEARADDGC